MDTCSAKFNSHHFQNTQFYTPRICVYPSTLTHTPMKVSPVGLCSSLYQISLNTRHTHTCVRVWEFAVFTQNHEHMYMESNIWSNENKLLTFSMFCELILTLQPQIFHVTHMGYFSCYWALGLSIFNGSQWSQKN